MSEREIEKERKRERDRENEGERERDFDGVCWGSVNVIGCDDVSTKSV